MESETNGHTALSVATDLGVLVDAEVVDVVDREPVVVVVRFVEDDLEPHPIPTSETANAVAATATIQLLLTS